MNTHQADKTFGEWAYIAIAKHYNKFIKYEKKVLKDKNSEHLHQMRVGMRRLRSALTGFAPAVNLPSAMTPNKVAKMAKTLGKLRDIDVLQETLTTKYQPYIPDGEQKSLNSILKKLKKERRLAFEDVAKMLDSNSYLKLKNNCQLWLDNPVYSKVAAIDIRQILPDLLLQQISYFLLHPGWLVGVEIINGQVDFSQSNNLVLEDNISLTQEKLLHDLRKVAKKTRYNMELFQDIYSQTYGNYLQEIAETQEILGNIQDCFVIENYLAENSNKDLKETMPTLIKILQKTRQENWQNWQTKQKYWLDSAKKQDLRTVVQYPQKNDLT